MSNKNETTQFPISSFQIDGGSAQNSFRVYELGYYPSSSTAKQILAKVFVTGATESTMVDTFATEDIYLPPHTEYWLVNSQCLNSVFRVASSEGAQGTLNIANLGEFENYSSQHNDLGLALADIGEIEKYTASQLCQWNEIQMEEQWISSAQSILFWLPQSELAKLSNLYRETCPIALRLNAKQDAGGRYYLESTTWCSSTTEYVFTGWEEVQDISFSQIGLDAQPRSIEPGTYRADSPMQFV